jgi:uncharacterized protein (DUF433 family)
VTAAIVISRPVSIRIDPLALVDDYVTMNKDELLARISVDPNVCFGKPCVRGHRIWVSMILDLLASGWTFAEVVDNFPGIEEADIRACIAYGAEMSRDRFVDLDHVVSH